MPSSVLPIAVAACTVTVLVSQMLAHLPPRVRRTLWLWSRPAPLAERRLVRSLRWMRRMMAAVVAAPSGSPLTIEPFTSATGARDAAIVGGAVRAGIGRVGSSRRSSVDVMTGRLDARPVVEEVADALSVVPQGKILAALLRVTRSLVGRGCLSLTGQVLDSAQRGPGLALALVAPRGQLIATTTLWAVDYEPSIAPGASCKDARDDRLLRLATAGAVWTHFSFMRARRGLRAEDFADTLGARDWKSYASLQIGLETRGGSAGAVTTAHYALAVDRDPENVVAQFNLASQEMRSPADRQGAAQRLRWIHKALERQHPRIEREVDGRELLKADPLHYQVLYKESAMALNEYVGASRHDPRAIEELFGAFRHLSGDLVALERTIGLLEPRVAGLRREPATAPEPHTDFPLRAWRWLREPWRRSGEGDAVYDLLRTVEGPSLVLWMSFDFHLCHTRPGAQLDDTRVTRSRMRQRLIDALASQTAAAGHTFPGRPDVVLTYLRRCGLVNSRTRYNLACYFADVGEHDKAWRELRRSLADGKYVDSARDDPELVPLHGQHERWTALMKVYGRSEGLACFDAIGTRHAEHLHEEGIDDPVQLLRRTRTPEGRLRLASGLHVGGELVGRWAGIAALATATDLSPKDVNRLDAAGLATVALLQALNGTRPNE